MITPPTSLVLSNGVSYLCAPKRVVSHRLYTLILRILHNRMVAAAELQSHSLLLECYQPSAKFTEPPYFCTYHSTDGLEVYQTPSEIDTNLAIRLGDMRNLYSRFRPHRRELETGGRRVRGPPGDVPGSRTFPGTVVDNYHGDTVKQQLSLDGHELFTQLVAQSNLVKIGPRNGLFTCFVEVEEGVVRVWREWLRDLATKGHNPTLYSETGSVDEMDKGKPRLLPTGDEKRAIDEKRTLWVSPAKNTGIRFNAKEKKIRRDAPVLFRADEEDMPVTYEIEYDGALHVSINDSSVLLTGGCRAPNTNFASSPHARKVDGARRQFFR